MKRLLLICFVLMSSVVSGSVVNSRSLTQQPTSTNMIGYPYLLSDGGVMVLTNDQNKILKLTPNEFGSYVQGTWSELSSLPDGYVSNDRKESTTLLPNGQLLSTASLNDVKVSTPDNLTYYHESAPAITDSPKLIRAGRTYKIKGKGVQATLHYPLVRVTNMETDRVYYCRTHDFTASKKEAILYFDVPDQIDEGRCKIEIISNGISSQMRHIAVN